MTQFVFGNFFATELTTGVSAAGLVLSVPPSASLKLPTISVGEDKQAMLTLWDGQLPPEIVACTVNQQTGSLTVLRAREGTTAQSWPAGTQVLSSLTAGVINGALAAYFDITGILNSNFLKLTGGTLTGPLTLSGLPTSALHAATKSYVDSVLGDKLPLSGGTMTGWINMNSQRIIALPSPIAGNEPATKTYADDILTLVNNYLRDQSGALASAGTADAYVVPSTASYPGGLVHGMTFTFSPHVTNTAGATVNFSGLGAKPIYTDVVVPAGYMLAFHPVTLVYLIWIDGWRILNTVRSDLEFSAGDFKHSAKTIDHGRWFLCDGRAVSRTGDTAALFLQCSTLFGVGDNVTTYNIPDCRGRVMAGLDNMTGVNANRLSSQIINSSAIGGVGGQQQVTLSIPQLPVVTPAGTVTTPTGTIAPITPTGTVTKPNVNISETPHLHAISIQQLASNVAGGATNIMQPGGSSNTVNQSTGITAALSATPIFTGDPFTPVFTGNVATFTGTAFGSGSAVPTVQPTIMTSIFVRY